MGLGNFQKSLAQSKRLKSASRATWNLVSAVYCLQSPICDVNTVFAQSSYCPPKNIIHNLKVRKNSWPIKFAQLPPPKNNGLSLILR